MRARCFARAAASAKHLRQHAALMQCTIMKSCSQATQPLWADSCKSPAAPLTDRDCAAKHLCCVIGALQRPCPLRTAQLTQCHSAHQSDVMIQLTSQAVQLWAIYIRRRLGQNHQHSCMVRTMILGVCYYNLPAQLRLLSLAAWADNCKAEKLSLLYVNNMPYSNKASAAALPHRQLPLLPAPATRHPGC